MRKKRIAKNEPMRVAPYRAGVRITFQTSVTASVETLCCRVGIVEVAVSAGLGCEKKTIDM